MSSGTSAGCSRVGSREGGGQGGHAHGHMAPASTSSASSHSLCPHSTTPTTMLPPSAAETQYSSHHGGLLPLGGSPLHSNSYAGSSSSSSPGGNSSLSMVGAELGFVNAHFARIFSMIKEERSKIETEKEALRNERRIFEESKLKVRAVNDIAAERVKLNVGGEIFETSLGTITVEDGSMLKAMFSGEFHVERDECDAVFLDRNPTYFPLVLSYLRQKRNRKLFSLSNLPVDRQAAEDAIEEAKFYGLSGLKKLLEESTFLVVCQQGGGRYISVKDALKDAVDGDKILIKKGIYFECLLLDKSVALEGEGEVVLTYSGEHVVTSCAETPSVRNCTIHQQGGEYHCMFVTAGCISVENCTFVSNGWACIGVSGEATHPYLTNNKLASSADNGIILLSSAKGLIEGNEISHFSLQGIEIREGSNPIIRANNIHHGSDSGIYINTKGQGVVEGNEIHHNAYNGIAVKFEGQPRRIADNSIHDNKHMGVFVSADSCRKGIDQTNNVANNAVGNIVEEQRTQDGTGPGGEGPDGEGQNGSTTVSSETMGGFTTGN